MARKLKLDLAAQDQGEGWFLILDPTPIPGYECVIEPAGMDFAEFDAHGRPGLWDHNRGIPPLCQWDYKVEGSKLAGRPNFDDPADNPMAATVAKLFSAGRLRLSAGLSVLEEGITTRDDKQYRHVTKSSLDEVSFVLYGAHPQAGTKMSDPERASLCLSQAVADGTITQNEADAVLPLTQNPHAHEVAELRAQVAALTETCGRLEGALAATRKPDATTAPLEATSHPGITKAQIQEELTRAVANIVEGADRQIASAVRRAVRKQLGRVD